MFSEFYIHLITIAPYGNAKNTPQQPLVDGNKIPGMKSMKSVFDKFDTIGENLKILVDNIKTFNDYVLHPSHFLKMIWKNICLYSYNACLFLAILGIVIFLLGNKKGGKLTMGSMTIFVIIKCLSFI